MASDELSRRISKLHKQIEDLRMRCVGDPGNAEVLNNALREMQISLEELCQQNEEPIEHKEELRRSEHYRLLFETMLPGVVYQDADCKIISMNPAAERILGKTQEVFLGSSSVGEEHHTIREDGSPFPGLEHPAMVALQTGQEVHDVVMGVFNPREDCYRWINIDAMPLFKPGEDKPYQVYTYFDDITERKRIAEESAKAHALLDTLLEMAHIGFAFLDRELRYVLVNKKLAEMNGFAIDVHIGKRVHDIVPTLVPAIQIVVDQIIETGQPLKDHEFSTENASAPGVKRYWNESWYPMKDSSGEITGFGVVVEEITERKRMTEALQQRDAVLDAFFEASPGILNIEDEAFRYITTDKLTPTYFGLNRQTMVGKAVADLAPEFIRDHGAMMRRVIETGQPEINVEVKSPVPSRPGEISYWRASYFPVPLPEGKQGIGIMGVDITDMKKAEEALQDSEERYRELVENANSIIIKMDRVGKITFFNDYAQKFFGYSLEEILGQNVMILIPPIASNGSNLEEMADNILENPDGFAENINENVRKNGERVWISWRNKAIRDARGEIIGNLTIGQDITERKKIEETLQRSNQKIEEILSSIREDF